MVTSHTKRNPSTKRKKKTVKSSIVFTNRLGDVCHDYSSLTAVIETSEARKKIASEHNPSRNLTNLVNLWGRKPPFNYCADILYSVAVVSKEVGFKNSLDLYRIHGWLVTGSKEVEDSFTIYYKRFEDCLQKHECRRNKSMHLKGIIDSLYARTDTTMGLKGNDLINGRKTMSSKKSENKDGSIHIVSNAAERRTNKAEESYDMMIVHGPDSFS